MRSFHRCAIVAGLITALVAGVSCSNTGPSAGQVGTVGFQLQVAPGVVINAVAWAITNTTTGFTRSGITSVQSSNTISFEIALPVGDGYAIALNAASVDGSLTCAGSTSFAVTAGAATDVPVTLVCTSAPLAIGSILVDGTTKVCGSITAVSAAPLETTVNTPIALSATATGASPAGASPTFAWTATAGTFDDAASAAPSFTCPATAGTVTITVTTGAANPACTAVASSSVTVTCDTLAPTFTNVYANVIGARCTSCHKPGGSGVTGGLLDLSAPAIAYAALVGVPAAGTSAGSAGVTCASLAPSLLRVSPGDATGSLLYDKVQTKLAGTLAECGSPMPLGSGGPLTQAQLDLVSAWIGAGALDN